MSRESGIDRIRTEHIRQINVEGYTEDNESPSYQLAAAAACYAQAVSDDMYDISYDEPPANWPWDTECWKHVYSNPLRSLEKAGALIAAAIDQLQREQNNAL